jgi:hypothetical protein
LPSNNASAWLLPTVALVAGVLGAVAVWVALAVATGGPCSWMGMLAAVDVALLLRLTGVGPGPGRVLAAVLATALAAALAQWLIVAAQLGIVLGLQPIDSAMRLGPALARQLLQLSLGRGDLAWLLACLPFAAWLATSNRRESAQAQAGGQ